MILGNTEIAYRGEDLISPYNPARVQPASYDCTLEGGFRELVRLDHPVELTDEPLYEPIHADYYIVPAGGFVLASVRERFNLPLVLDGEVKGRSSVGRQGIFVQNAGFVDPGFKGKLTLEIFNASPNALILRAGQVVCQVAFAEVGGCHKGYDGRYQGQDEVTGSRLYLDKKFSRDMRHQSGIQGMGA